MAWPSFVLAGILTFPPESTVKGSIDDTFTESIASVALLETLTDMSFSWNSFIVAGATLAVTSSGLTGLIVDTHPDKRIVEIIKRIANLFIIPPAIIITANYK